MKKSAGEGRTILIVEDVEPAASTLEIAFSGIDDFNVIAMSGGEEAWRYFLSGGGESVCALVTDLHMPGLDGFELIEKIRSDSRFARLPIIVLSGCTDPRTPARVAALGASAFFEKPYSPVQVRARLEQLLHVKQSASQAL
jgi:DNA-binding response OmpR family regulator